MPGHKVNTDVSLPTYAGVWRNERTTEEIDVYPLVPVNSILCLWGPDIGYQGDSSDIWDTDEFIGHIPVHRYEEGSSWTFVRALSY
jgi:hypothetical protein